MFRLHRSLPLQMGLAALLVGGATLPCSAQNPTGIDFRGKWWKDGQPLPILTGTYLGTPPNAQTVNGWVQTANERLYNNQGFGYGGSNGFPGNGFNNNQGFGSGFNGSPFGVNNGGFGFQGFNGFNNANPFGQPVWQPQGNAWNNGLPRFNVFQQVNNNPFGNGLPMFPQNNFGAWNGWGNATIGAPGLNYGFLGAPPLTGYGVGGNPFFTFPGFVFQ